MKRLPWVGKEAEDDRRYSTETHVSFHTLGEIDSTGFQDALAELSIYTGNQREFCIVLTDDYLHADLDFFNHEALVHKLPWLLVKPVGTELWLGPLFIPGRTGCWECLAHRLRGARTAEHFLREKSSTADVVTVPYATLPSTPRTAFSLCTAEVAKWVTSGKNENFEGRIIAVDTLSLKKNSHPLVRRPQCPVCGDPKFVADHQATQVTLQSHKKTVNSDAGTRSVSLEQTLKQIEHHVSPITGIVNLLEPASEWVEASGFTPPYIAGHNFFHAVRDYGSDWEVLLDSLQDSSAGKGRDPLQSKVSALCEAVERYSGVFQGDEARIKGKFVDIGEAAIHPNACMLYSQQQYENREEWNARGSRLPMTWVPEPFDEDKEIEWSPVWSLTHEEKRYLPTGYCFYDYSRQHKTWFTRGDSNGCAAGHNKEEAILHGFMELVERDCVAVWWYNRLRRPLVDLSTFDDPYFQEILTYYENLDRTVWVLDISSDLGIPAFAALSCRNDEKRGGVLYGFGTHFDPQVACMRALTEMDQQLPAFSSVITEKGGSVLGADPEMIEWWQTATVANQPYLLPDENAKPKRKTDYPNRSSDDFRTDVLTCVKLAKERGLETLVLDQTRPDIGLPVVKVIVPGLRHFWARFGPGRLYDVPVHMGWLPRPLTEDELNPQYIYV